MSSLNKAVLIGRLTKDPELRYTQSGTAKEFFLMEFDGIKRAVKYFKIIRKKHIGGTSDFYDLAINALERQIPQKPREHYHWGDFTKEEKLENNQWFCGKCGWQIGEEDNYCNECGQKVDWS